MSGESCQALYSYNGVGGGEKIQTLTFEAGVIIKILFSGDTGWWEGEVNGVRGWFPASYVKRIQEADTGSNASEDWKELTSENGETYYLNMKTNETSWSIPSTSESSEERVVPQSVESSVSQSVESSVNSSSNNLHGNTLHLPLLNSVGPMEAVSQPTTPHGRQESMDSPHSKSLPITPNSPPSPVQQRSKKLASPSTPSTPTEPPHKPRIRMLNGMSFPGDREAKEQTLLHPGKFSYCDYFWSDRLDNHNSYHTGFSVIYQKILKGKQMCKEVSDLFKAREAIEVHYAKSLATLANSVHASQEEGTLGEALSQVKRATLAESEIHQEFANKLRNEVCQQLLEQRDKDKKELKKLDSSLAELRKQVLLKYQATERAKQQLLERGRDLETKLNSPKHTKEEIQKARRKSTKQAEEHTHAVDAYNKQRHMWFEEMVTSSLALERHEAARINKVKLLLSRYTDLLRNSNNKGNETCNTLGEYIKKTDPDKDRETWVRRHATGKVRPVDLVQ